jgi:hypothetical protein
MTGVNMHGHWAITRAKGTRGFLAVLFGCLVVFNALDAARLNAQFIRAKDGVPLPAFDVASVKQNNSGSDGTHVLSKDARYSVENLPLREILKIASGAKSDAQITGGPAAILRNRYDIEAKIDEEQFAQIKTMSSEDAAVRLASCSRLYWPTDFILA